MVFENINYDEFQAMIRCNPYVLLLDIRSREDYMECRYPGSINIPLPCLLSRINTIASYKDCQVIVFCDYGHHSGTACQLLYSQGFTNLFNLQGGIDNIL
ncbi:MAG: rhodanese-like domain-containing protein [Clostridioides sp.]|jgi:rhodanese-related sulfurtransferase|nr:rhodanese-like domain-containing protein [Clostridioides sp.]